MKAQVQDTVKIMKRCGRPRGGRGCRLAAAVPPAPGPGPGSESPGPVPGPGRRPRRPCQSRWPRGLCLSESRAATRVTLTEAFKFSSCQWQPECRASGPAQPPSPPARRTEPPRPDLNLRPGSGLTRVSASPW